MNLIYGKSVPTLQCDKTKSLATILCETMLQYSKEEISAVDAVTKKHVTYHQTLSEAIVIAEQFQSLGVGKNDVVAFMIDNTIHVGSYILGALLADVIFAPLNPTFTSYELEQICSWLQPKVIVCNSTNIDKIKSSNFVSCPIIIEYCVPNNSNISKSLVLNDFDNFLRLDKLPNDPVMIICSSGTTGMPKGVVHTNFSILSALDYLSDTQLGAASTDVVLAYLPFYHLMGVISLFGNFYCGQKLIVMQKFKPQVFLNAVQEFKVNKMYIVPTIGLFLTQYDDIVNYDLSSLKEMICAGSMLSVATYTAIKTKLPNADLRLAYGMSEINYTTITPPFCEYIGSVGQLLAGVIGKVIDTETNEALPAYKIGELCICSKSNFLGYYRNPKETLNTMDEEGYVHTGDTVYYNEHGDIFIVDRIKDLIKYKSFQVSPTELEAILLKHDSVADVGVIGVPDEKCGELPKAFVVLKHNQNNKEQNTTGLQRELQDFVAKHVSVYKQLTGGIHFVHEIPKNPSGKILRKQLKAKYFVEE